VQCLFERLRDIQVLPPESCYLIVLCAAGIESRTKEPKQRPGSLGLQVEFMLSLYTLCLEWIHSLSRVDSSKYSSKYKSQLLQ
jgi:hypothetical protein